MEFRDYWRNLGGFNRSQEDGKYRRRIAGGRIELVGDEIHMQTEHQYPEMLSLRPEVDGCAHSSTHVPRSLPCRRVRCLRRDGCRLRRHKNAAPDAAHADA